LKIDQSALSHPFEHISKIIRDSYTLNEFELKYLDDEQDYCLIASEEEMKEALRGVSKDTPLKLFVQKISPSSLPQPISSPPLVSIHDLDPFPDSQSEPKQDPSENLIP